MSFIYTPPRSGATILVAASNASYRSIQRADYVCSGSADETTISSAVAALPAGGGKILFSEGTFTLSTAYLIVNSNIAFEGMGVTTIFQTSSNGHCFASSSTAISNISFSNMTFLGPVNQTVSVPTLARTTSGNGIDIAIWIDGSLDTTGSYPLITNITVKNCQVRNCTSLPIRLFGITGVTRVTDCEFTNCKDVGFGFDEEVICSNNHSKMSADNGFSISRGCNKITCTGNTVELCCFKGIWIAGFLTNTGPQDFSCTGNTVKNCGNSGIYLWDAPQYGTVSGNMIDCNYNRGPVDSLTDIDCNGISVRGYPSTAPASPTTYTVGLNISNNTIRRAPRSAIYLNGCQGVIVSNNIFMDTGTQYYSDGVTSIGTNLSAQTNPQDVGIYIDSRSAVTDVYIYGNVCLDQRGTPYCIQFMYPNMPISGVTQFNNVQNGCRLGSSHPYSVRSDVLGYLTTGEETMPRWAASTLGNITMVSGALRLAYFRARRNETVTQIKLSSGTTAAGATPTLVRYGLYSVDSSGNLTLQSAITSDTSIFASTLTDYTRSMAASVTLVEGQIYAIGAIVVTAATAPSVCGSLCCTPASDALDPRLCGVWTAQTDLPNSITAANVAVSQSFLWAQVL